jgi:ketosteroid isomerase-like protein
LPAVCPHRGALFNAEEENTILRANSPQQVVELIDKAFHAGDVESLVDMYDPAGVQIDYLGVNDYKEVRGREGLLKLYSGLLKPGRFTVEQIKTHVTEADGIALLTSRWSIASENVDPKYYVASIVLRRQPDGSWKDLIDSSPSVLDL